VHEALYVHAFYLILSDAFPLTGASSNYHGVMGLKHTGDIPQADDMSREDQ
jgi:hypothetical protein